MRIKSPRFFGYERFCNLMCHYQEFCREMLKSFVQIFLKLMILVGITVSVVCAVELLDYFDPHNSMASQVPAQRSARITYSRTELLLHGKWVLSKVEKQRIDLEKYKMIRQLGICSVNATKRGKKGGLRTKETALLGLN